MLNSQRGDRLVGLAPQIEGQEFAGRRLEEVEREVRGQDAADTVCGSGAGQRDLPVHDGLAPALQRRDHNVNADGGVTEARGVGDVALDDLGAAPHEPFDLGTLVGVGEGCRADE